jgi:glucan-binding YG repeat protein
MLEYRAFKEGEEITRAPKRFYIVRDGKVDVDKADAHGVQVRNRWVRVRGGWVTLSNRWATLRGGWVTLSNRWVTLRGGWVTLSNRWVTLRGGWVCLPPPWCAADEERRLFR